MPEEQTAPLMKVRDLKPTTKQVSLVAKVVSIGRGHIRLNVGKYGSFSKSTTTIGEVSTATDISAAEHERPEREFRGGSGGGYGGGSSGGGDSSGRSSGYSGSRGGSRFGGERREHGRRRF